MSKLLILLNITSTDVQCQFKFVQHINQPESQMHSSVLVQRKQKRFKLNMLGL